MNSCSHLYRLSLLHTCRITDALSVSPLPRHLALVSAAGCWRQWNPRWLTGCQSYHALWKGSATTDPLQIFEVFPQSLQRNSSNTVGSKRAPLSKKNITLMVNRLRQQHVSASTPCKHLERQIVKCDPGGDPALRKYVVLLFLFLPLRSIPAAIFFSVM